MWILVISQFSWYKGKQFFYQRFWSVKFCQRLYCRIACDGSWTIREASRHHPQRRYNKDLKIPTQSQVKKWTSLCSDRIHGTTACAGSTTSGKALLYQASRHKTLKTTVNAELLQASKHRNHIMAKLKSSEYFKCNKQHNLPSMWRNRKARNSDPPWTCC